MTSAISTRRAVTERVISPRASSFGTWTRIRTGWGPLLRTRSTTRFSGHSENTTIAVPTNATSHQLAPTAIPTAAVAHRLAAVVRPRTDVPYHDRARAEETDAGYDLGSDPRRVGRARRRGVAEPVDREHGEDGRAEADEQVSPHPRRMVVDLALEADDRAEEGRAQQPYRQVELEPEVDR